MSALYVGCVSRHLCWRVGVPRPRVYPCMVSVGTGVYFTSLLWACACPLSTVYPVICLYLHLGWQLFSGITQANFVITYYNFTIMFNVLNILFYVQYPSGHQFGISSHTYFTTKVFVSNYYVTYSMFNLSVIYFHNMPPWGGASEFVYWYPHPFSLCFQDCYHAGTQSKTCTTRQGNSTTRTWWSC